MTDKFLPKSVPHGGLIFWLILQGGPFLAAKIGLAGPILAAIVVRGTGFGRFFCQNQSGQTNFRGTDFGVTGA